MAFTLPAALRLTEHERRFVYHLVKHGQPEVAWAQAGYSGEPHFAHVSVLLSNANVAAAVTIALSQMLRTEAAPLAYRVGLALMKNEKAGERVRADMVKTFLDRAGLPAAKAVGVDKGGDKSLHEMSADELRRYIDKAESELADRAKPVISVPAKASQEANSVDMFE